jgi:hypothetical protein
LTVHGPRRSEGAEGAGFAGHPTGKDAEVDALVIAGLAFANSDFAFQGTHLFQGNFYGINFYDISNPAKVSLITSLVCPGGQGDVSVYGNLLFMSVEMPNGRLDCGTQAFRRILRRPRDMSMTATAGGQPGSFSRRKNLRYFRHQKPEAGGGGADLPRLAHAYAGGRPERQGQRLHLRLGNVVCAAEGGACRLLDEKLRIRIRTLRCSASM